jgi:hypothetical protein
MDEAIEPNASYVARLGKEDPAGISSYGGFQPGSAATRRSASSSPTKAGNPVTTKTLRGYWMPRFRGA